MCSLTKYLIVFNVPVTVSVFFQSVQKRLTMHNAFVVNRTKSLVAILKYRVAFSLIFISFFSL